MDVSRRTFFKTGIAGAVGVTVFGFDAQPILAQADSLKISRSTETRSTCPYCAGELWESSFHTYWRQGRRM